MRYFTFFCFPHKSLQLAVYFTVCLNLDEPDFKYSTATCGKWHFSGQQSSKPFKGLQGTQEEPLEGVGET